jgi:hypothetical protein
MVRADRNQPDFWFGYPGKLIKLPWPKGGIEKPYERQTFDFLTGSGNHQVSTLSTGSRIYGMTWRALHLDNYAKLSQYRVGANGPGPWFLADPSAPNLLPANVASATGLYNNATHFIISGFADGGTVGSNSDATHIHRTAGHRSIRWQFLSAASAFPVLGVSPQYRSWPGHPVVPGLPYTWSSWIKPDGVVDTSVTISMKLTWLDSAGATISEPSSGDQVITTWTRLICQGVAPVNAAYVKPIWVATGSSITTGSAIYIDEPLLEQDNVVNDWAPGTGIKPMEIVSLTDATMFASRFREAITLQLRELAR